MCVIENTKLTWKTSQLLFLIADCLKSQDCMVEVHRTNVSDNETAMLLSRTC